MSKLVCGVGINDAGYKVQIKTSERLEGKRTRTSIWKCPFYVKWQNMLERCYSKREAYHTYEGCVVCEEWLIFSNFKKWMEKQNWEGKYLDKDLLGDGKIYSVDTCCFLDNQTNTFIINNKTSLQSLPRGVHKDRGNKSKYLCYIADPRTKSRMHIGYSNTVKRATQVQNMYLHYFSYILSKRYAGVVVVKLKSFSDMGVHLTGSDMEYYQEKVTSKVNVANTISSINLTDECKVYILEGNRQLLSGLEDCDWEEVLYYTCVVVWRGIQWLNLQNVYFNKEELIFKTNEICGLNRHDLRLLQDSVETKESEYFKTSLVNLVKKISKVCDLKQAFDIVLSNKFTEDQFKSSVNMEKFINI